jgi:hypothetical protein
MVTSYHVPSLQKPPSSIGLLISQVIITAALEIGRGNAKAEFMVLQSIRERTLAVNVQEKKIFLQFQQQTSPFLCHF